MKRSGQTLVEMVVIIGIVVVLATGIIAGSTISIARTQGDQKRSTALGLAQEGIELARALRDEGWSQFTILGTFRTVYCVGSDKGFVKSDTQSCTVSNIAPDFTRSVILQLLNSGDPVNEKMSVDVIVSWPNSGTTGNQVQLQSYLTQWR